MISAIKTFFDQHLADDSADDPSHDYSRLDLASAALLIEVMHSDSELDQRENQEFLKLLKDSYGIPESDIAELTKLAEAEAREATSLYEFTRLINDEFDYEAKVRLIENMWRIAFSDKELDKYEDHLIRKISELIYVSHSDFIRTKLQVRDDSSN